MEVASVWGKRPRLYRATLKRSPRLVSEKTERRRNSNLNVAMAVRPKNSATLMYFRSAPSRWLNSARAYHADKNRAIHRARSWPFPRVQNLEEEVGCFPWPFMRHPAVAKEMGAWNARMLMTSRCPTSNKPCGHGRKRRDTLESNSKACA